MNSDGVEKVVQLAYSWTFPGVMTGNSPAETEGYVHWMAWTNRGAAGGGGDVPTTPGPWTSSTFPSEVVIFQ